MNKDGEEYRNAKTFKENRERGDGRRKRERRDEKIII